VKSAYGPKGGVEYSGSQRYQPGDSLKDIDWKHSLQYRELISKQFSGFRGQPAVVLVNLAVGNAEEADRLAYKIIMTALSLAQENIPAALAAYDDEGVRVATRVLRPRELLLRSLEVAQKMVSYINPVRYLSPPDVSRLRSDIARLRSAQGQAAAVLGELLELEYENLKRSARHNPASTALSVGLRRAGPQANVVVISEANHDAEALAFSVFSLAQKGNVVIGV